MKKRHKNKNTREINLKETSLLHDAIALNSQPPWKLESAIILSLLHPIPFQVLQAQTNWSNCVITPNCTEIQLPYGIPNKPLIKQNEEGKSGINKLEIKGNFSIDWPWEDLCSSTTFFPIKMVIHFIHFISTI